MAALSKQTPRELVLKSATFSRLICVSSLEHLGPGISDPIEKKRYNGRTHKIWVFSRTTEEENLKCQKLKNRKNWVKISYGVDRGLNRNSKYKFLCKSDLKERVEN